MELEFLQFLILLIITGVFSGLIAGLLGVGGGLVIIPVVFYILNFFNSFYIKMSTQLHTHFVGLNKK